MVVKPTIACGVVECLGRMWTNGDFCDFTVIVEDGRIQCHRCVLSACSQFFHGLLKSEMKEKAEGCVEVGNVTKPTMEVILNSVYTGQDGLTIENVVDVWHASNQLQISFMLTECEDFVMEHMNTDNYLAMYEQAKILQSSAVIKFTHQFMTENFEHFLKTETFFNLPVDILHPMVDSQDLAVSSENYVVESILEWIRFNPQQVSQSKLSNDAGEENTDNDNESSPGINTDTESGNEARKVHLAKLLSASRLYLCTPGFLETLRYNKLVCLCPLSLSIIFDALMHKMSFGRHNDCWPSQAVQRTCSLNQVGVIYAVIRSKQKDHKIIKYAQFYFYNFLDNKKFSIFDLDLENADNFSITVFNNELYCYNGNMYALGDNKEWSKVNQNQERLNKTKLLSHGDFIYASTLSSMYTGRGDIPFNYTLFKLKINSSTGNNWHRCMETVGDQKEEHSLVSCGRYILLFNQNHGATNTSVRCYSPEKQATRELEDIEGNLGNVISFCAEKQVYVLQGNGSLWEAVNCHDDTDTLYLQFVCKLWDFNYPIHNAAFYRGRLYLFVLQLKAGSNYKWSLSLPGVFDSIKVVQMEHANTFCLMVAPKSWLKKQ